MSIGQHKDFEMRRFSSDCFTYSEYRMLAEASDLQLPPGSAVRDFEIESARTGAVVHFTMTDVQRDAEGDVTHWIYRSQGKDQFGNDWDDIFTTMIFND